jgi:hypothetical protein
MAKRGSVERALMGCGALAILAVLAVVLLGLGALLGNSDVDVDIEEPIEDILDEQDGGDESAPVQAGAPGRGSAPLVVRLTGPPGTAYSGTYGTAQGGMTPVEGVLGAEPAEYAVEAAGGSLGELRAVFQKSQPVPGMLRAEVLSSGEVVAQGSTSEASDLVEVNWSP